MAYHDPDVTIECSSAKLIFGCGILDSIGCLCQKASLHSLDTCSFNCSYCDFCAALPVAFRRGVTSARRAILCMIFRLTAVYRCRAEQEAAQREAAALKKKKAAKDKKVEDE